MHIKSLLDIFETMRWKCPECRRSFSKENQIHSCRSYSRREIFQNKSPEMIVLYNQIEKWVLKLGDIVVDPVNYDFMFRGDRLFLGITPRKKNLDIVFCLRYNCDEFPILKSYQQSKNRFFHLIKIESNDEFDQQLQSWINESYQTVGRKA